MFTRTPVHAWPHIEDHMRLRSSSIRARIITLLMVPIVALAALWAYAIVVTTGDVRNQLNLSATYREFDGPIDRYATDLQAERRVAVLKLAGGYTKAADDAFQKAQQDTDRDLAVLRAKASKKGMGNLDADQRARFQDVLARADLLVGVRSRAKGGLEGWSQTLGEYSDLITPTFAFRTGFFTRQTGQLPRQGTVLVELVRAREFLSQEATAMEALRIAPDSEARQVQVALDALHSQQALFRIYIGELDGPDQRAYLDLQGSVPWEVLSSAEQGFEEAFDRVHEVKSSVDDPWSITAGKVLADLSDLNTGLATGIGDHARSAAITALVRGGIAGTLGLGAVVLSVVISSRIGRKLVRDLVSLRDSATDLSSTKLPSVMLRLRRGEPVDVAAEAPQLDLGEGEIGQVGRAFSEVQRAAVEAAVEQAELRRGVSAVFVNLARRSQVLLHRQLTLLDTMERRTEKVQDLEDLFRIDHLTTRMRRHAEGLIILAGGSPGRAWRKPVRMIDVVRSAVGEVEDYARVVVRPFPATALLGSAVADITHLVAELVENAAVYSPPHTQVTVRGEVVAHGFCVEIDDRGLGLSAQALAEINQRIELEQEFDLADTDRLGLFVVSRLARRHGIKVHLRPSQYGGTSAVVLIPRELLADPIDLTADQDAAVAEPEAPKVGGGPKPALVEPARTPGGLPRRRAAGGEQDAAEGGGRHRRKDSPPEVRPVPTSPAHAARPQVGPSGLPRRVRQASLAPQLRQDTAAVETEQTKERSAEEARATFASFQRGFQRGRGDRLQPASLTLVPDLPIPSITIPSAETPSRATSRAALPAAPQPAALTAASTPSDRTDQAVQARPAQPAPAEGTDS